MTNPAPSQPYDVTANHVELLLTNVRLSVNPLLLKYRTPFFIMTPSNCDGSNYQVSATDEIYWMKNVKNVEESVAGTHVPYKCAKHHIADWPIDEDEELVAVAKDYKKNREEYTNRDKKEVPSLKRSQPENSPSHEDGGAKVILRGGLVRFAQLDQAQLDLVIDLTHKCPTMSYSRAELRKWFHSFLDKFATRLLDWIEARLLLVLRQIGTTMGDATAEHRIELWSFIFDQHSYGILSGMYGGECGTSFDFAFVYGRGQDKERRKAWRTYFRHLFTMLCEQTLSWAIFMYGMKEAKVKAARSMRKALYLAMAKDDPTMKALKSRLGGLGDIPLGGFTNSSSLMLVPGCDYRVIKPAFRPRGNRRQ